MAGFEATNEWSQTSSMTATLDTVNKVQGAASVRYSASATSAGPTNGINLNKDFTFDPATLGCYAFAVKLDDDIDWQDWQAYSFNVLVNATGTVWPGASKTAQANVQWGCRWVSGNVANMDAAVRNAGMGTHRIRLSSTTLDAPVGDTNLDAVYQAVGESTKPAIIFGFHDAKATQHTVGYPIMAPLGIIGEAYPPKDKIGTAGVMTESQLVELGTVGGWSIQTNGTTDDRVINSAADGRNTVAAWIDNLNAGADYVESLGFPRPMSFAYPFNFKRSAGTKVLKTGVTLTGGSNTMTIADTTGLAIGQRIVAKPLTKAAVVQDIVGTTVTMSEPFQFTATTAQTVKFVTVTSDFHGTKPQLAAIAAGWKWGQSTDNEEMFVGFGISRAQAIQYPAYPGDGMTLSVFQGIVNRAISTKSMCSFYIHDIGVGGWTTAEFTACMNWLKTQIDLGLIECMTTPMIEAKYGNATVPA
jgi:hypothetical protein